MSGTRQCVYSFMSVYYTSYQFYKSRDNLYHQSASILYSFSVMFHQQLIYSLIILYLSNLMVVLRFTLYYLRISWEFVVFEISCICFYICLNRLVVSRLGGNKTPFMSFVHYIFMTARSGRLVLLYKISPDLDIVFPLPLCCILTVVFI